MVGGARVGGVESREEPKRWQELEEWRVEGNQRGGKSWRSGWWRGTKEGARVGGVEGGEGEGGKSRKGERDKEYVTFIREEGM